MPVMQMPTAGRVGLVHISGLSCALAAADRFPKIPTLQTIADFGGGKKAEGSDFTYGMKQAKGVLTIFTQCRSRPCPMLDGCRVWLARRH